LRRQNWVEFEDAPGGTHGFIQFGTKSFDLVGESFPGEAAITDRMRIS
jgi:hypothetical protein